MLLNAWFLIQLFGVARRGPDLRSILAFSVVGLTGHAMVVLCFVVVSVVVVVVVVVVLYFYLLSLLFYFVVVVTTCCVCSR